MPAKPRRFHYAIVVTMITFIVLFVSASVRSMPQVFIKPFEKEFGWDRGSISLAVAISLFAFGFGGPIGGSLVDRFGPRRVMLGGMILIAFGLLPMLGITQLWQLDILWGVVVGVGTGAVANVLGATVANRWFQKYRGLVVGLLGAAAAVGQLIFLPALIGVTNQSGWRTALIILMAAVVLMLPFIFLLMRDRPEQIGVARVGASDPAFANAATRGEDNRKTTLREAIRTRDFWLLAGSFFVCGYTTNGLIQTHLLPHTVEHGFVEVETAGALALMGAMNIIGTLLSGWLSDRFDNRKLLATYYGFRAMSLFVLPFIIEMRGLTLFAVVYGLDWIATVPPTVNLTAQRFGRASLGTLYGWIFCSHMIGAGIAAYAGGLFRTWLGDYHLIFISAGVMGIIAVSLSLSITSPRKMIATRLAPADAPGDSLT